MARAFILPPTPVLDRMGKVVELSQGIGEFLKWLLDEQEFILCKVHTVEYAIEAEYFPALLGDNGIRSLLADYFGIDLDEVYREQDRVLEALREYNSREVNNE